MDHQISRAIPHGQHPQSVFDHIRANAVAIGYQVIAIDGWYDHVHPFMRLPRTVSFASVAHRLKGESSYRVNRLELTDDEFAWQKDYAAYSISDNDRGAVKKYVENQQRHHRADPLWHCTAVSYFRPTHSSGHALSYLRQHGRRYPAGAARYADRQTARVQ